MHNYDQTIEPTANNAGEFSDGNPQAGLPPTVLRSFWCNQVQRELLNIIADPKANDDHDGPLTPDKTQFNQVVQAINNIAAAVAQQAASTAQQAAETYADQAAATASAGARPIGLIESGPYSIIPANAIALDHSITATGGLGSGLYLRDDFPVLWDWINAHYAVVSDSLRNSYPGRFTQGNGHSTFRVPDMRGVFVRSAGGAAEALGQLQQDILGSHDHTWQPGNQSIRYGSGHGTSSGTGISSAAPGSGTAIAGTISSTGGSETRPVNVAWRWVVWAK